MREGPSNQSPQSSARGPQVGGAAVPVPTADETARRAFALFLAGTGEGLSFLMTARHESSRRGLVVPRVMACADAPMSVCVSLPKGHPISPLVRDSRGFALCAIDPSDRVLLRLFERREQVSSTGMMNGQGGFGVAGGGGGGGSGSGSGSGGGGGGGGGVGAEGDPFISLELESLLSGAPLVKRCRYALDFKVTMHLDFESDHEMYIGMVVGGREYSAAVPPPTGGAGGGAEKKKGRR
ncbi:MAG: hypothetical protein ACKVZJ_08245 [Phycisphaerales bacterium]